jgi:hypothetical protein
MFLSKYGEARHIYIPIVKRAVVDFAVGADWTPAAGDVKISKDGGAAANVTNLPTAITMGNGAMWDFSLTATEMQAAQVKVTVVDAATKAVEDQMFVIETYGNASAQHAFDLDTASTPATVVEGTADTQVLYLPASSTWPFFFRTSGTLTGLAVGDIKIYKNGSVTQRTSTAGFTLLDTDGIDFDGIPNVHGFSIDLSDNTDAGFYAVGSIYTIVLDSVLVDGNAKSFPVATFRIMEQENPSGVPDVNLTHINGTAIPTPNVAGVLKVDVTHNNGTAIVSAAGRQEVNVTHVGGSTASQVGGLLNSNITQVSGDSVAADNLETVLDNTGTVQLGATIVGITEIPFPTNFSDILIDETGLVSTNVKKINDRTIVGQGQAGSSFTTTA